MLSVIHLGGVNYYEVMSSDDVRHYPSATGKYKIIIDRSLCIGAASCVVLAPDVYELDQESKAVVIDADAADFETILQAAQSCPTNAIIIEDENGNQVWPKI